MRFYSILSLFLICSGTASAGSKKTKVKENLPMAQVEIVQESTNLPALCDQSLLAVAEPLDTARVVELPEDFTVHPSTLAANGNPFVFKERKLLVDQPGAMFKVTQVDTSDFSIVDVQGNRILTHRHLRAAVDSYLQNKRQFQYGHFESALITPDGKKVIFSFRDSHDVDYVASLSLDDPKQGLKILFEKPNSYAPRMHIEHERFVVIHAGPEVAIYDLKKNLSLKVNNSFLPKEPLDKDQRVRTEKVSISKDGKTLLLTVNSFWFGGKEHNDSLTNHLVKLSYSWEELQEEVYEANSIGKTKKFAGSILAHSEDLTRFVVDTTEGKVNNNREIVSHPYVLPELEVVEISGSKIVRKSLNGWNILSAKIKEATQRGTVLANSSVRGSMTGDGRKFMLDLDFKTEIDLPINGNPKHLRRFSFNQNLVNLWDLESDSSPQAYTSSELDTEGDVEPNPIILGRHGRRLWDRNYASKLLGDGTVIMVRTMVQDKTKTTSEVILKVGIINNQGQMDLKEYNTGAVNLNPHSTNEGWTGSHSLQISPDGKKVIYDITGVGLKLIDISR